MFYTPQHIPVLLDEVINALSISDNELYVDATFGLGGYTKAILNKKNCKVVAIDRDPEVKTFAEKIKIDFKKRFFFKNGRFSQLVNILDEYNDDINPLLQGYKGVAFMLMSKHSINPLQKLKLFIKGKDMLENSIIDNKWNVELRFLRHSIQSNVPAFLNYSSSLTEDKSIILSSLHSIEDLDLKQMIKLYILKSKSFDLQEKQIIL